MAWLEISLSTCCGSMEEAAAALTAGGFSDLVMEDQQEFETFLDENREYWDYIDENLQQKLQGLSCIKLYLEQSDTCGMQKLSALVDSMRQSGRFGPLEMTIATLAETDWSESWKDNYPPQPVGQHLTVLPYWLADTDTDGRIPVILDPGLTFGTGAHPSTQMVMEAMERSVCPGWQCLDLGSGSGILSITALRLGAKAATGVDIDPKAEDIARENAAYNGFTAPTFTAMTGNVTGDQKMMRRLSEEKYDLLLVNIVADVIISLCPVLPRLMTEDTLLICSGILDSRLNDVLTALDQVDIQVTAVHAKEDWRCVEGKRRI